MLKFLSYEIDKVISLLADEASKVAYAKEIAFKIMHTIIDAKRINYFNNVFNFGEFNKILNEFAQDEEFINKYGVNFDNTRRYGLACTTKLKQYQYHDIVAVEQGDIFFDIGACFGEASIWALDQGASQVYSFDAATTNLEILENSKQEGMIIVDKAVGSENTRINFHQHTKFPGSRKISANQGVSVEQVRLDDFCNTNKIKPDFIKMDIEGSELDALQGCEEIIRNAKPTLAICLYHKPTDMWEIPLFIHTLVPTYKLYCKKSHWSQEFVMLCVNDPQ